MKGGIMKTLAMTVMLLALAGAADARSNIEVSVAKDLRADGVPESCIGKMTLADATRIRSIQDGADRSDGEKNRRVKTIVAEICER